MLRRTVLKTGVASVLAGFFPKLAFAGPKAIMTVRFTETATGTKWLIKYIDGIGYKVLKKSRLVFRESDEKVEYVCTELNYITDNKKDSKAIKQDAIYVHRPGVVDTKIPCKKLSVEYDSSWLDKPWDERNDYCYKAFYGNS